MACRQPPPLRSRRDPHSSCCRAIPGSCPLTAFSPSRRCCFPRRPSCSVEAAFASVLPSALCSWSPSRSRSSSCSSPQEICPRTHVSWRARGTRLWRALCLNLESVCPIRSCFCAIVGSSAQHLPESAMYFKKPSNPQKSLLLIGCRFCLGRDHLKPALNVQGPSPTLPQSAPCQQSAAVTPR